MQLDHWEPLGPDGLEPATSVEPEGNHDQAADWDEPLELYDSNSAWSRDGDDDSEAVEAPSADQISELLRGLSTAIPAPSPKTTDSTSQPHSTESDAAKSDRAAAGSPRRSEPNPDPPRTPPADLAGKSAGTIESLDQELREAFLDDATSCVGAIEGALLRLEADPHDQQAVGEICRQLHTLKGASASVGLSGLADQLHGLEDTLRDDQQAQRAPHIPNLFAHLDSVRDQILGPPTAPVSAAMDTATEVAGIPQTPLVPPASFDDGCDDDETVRVKTAQLNRLMDMLAQLVMLRNRRDTELAELHGIHRELVGSAAKMRLLSNESEPQASECASLQLSELANDVLEIAAQVRECAQPIADGNEAVSHFIRDFRRELVQLRRTPIGGLFRRLQRVVRDAAESERKEVKLQLIGQETCIERSLQQRLYEPLLHIVRNAVCHGIESPERRRQLGKTETGVISLEAKSGPDLCVIEIRDDGGGLDYDAIRRRGIEAGLLTAGQNVSRQELSQLIFRPGFSTRAAADQVAGRGVGMDVVASTLQRMRGWLEVESEQGRGTCIQLSFPLPSVIQHAMVFRAGGQLFALPMQAIVTTGDVGGDAARLDIAGLVRGIAARSTEHNQQIVISGETAVGNSHPTATESTGLRRIILAVDEIVGPEELVVRPLPPLLKNHPYCGGATLSGMGETVLFLDPHRLGPLQRRTPATVNAPKQSSLRRADSAPADSPAAPRVLVVDDSVSARKRVVRSLRRYVVQIDEACDGKAALAMLKRQRYAAIFSDMEMPHVSGLELLADVHALGKENPPPVIIISSRGEPEFTERARELGAAGYLSKPLSDAALDGALGTIPALRQLSLVGSGGIAT